MAYTTIDNPELYFQTKIYTGNGANDRAITFDGDENMQPDWLWIKNRSEAQSHALFDSVRGATKRHGTNNASAESTENTNLDSFDSNGFTVDNELIVNGSDDLMVAWAWKAGTSFSNDASSTSVGSIDSTGSVNTDAGFSIISYAGTGSAATVAHGLGVAPAWILLKDRDSGSHDWFNYHQSLGNGKYVRTNSDDGSATASTIWNDTSPTSSVFSIGTNENMSTSGNNFIAYCFAEKKGYSKFGSYTGNGNANGTFVYTGFKPAMVILKLYSAAGENWYMFDNKRDTNNVMTQILYPNLNNAEATGTTNIDFLSNGFKLRNAGDFLNGNGRVHIYMAFAENPFVNSNGIPNNAR